MCQHVYYSWHIKEENKLRKVTFWTQINLLSKERCFTIRMDILSTNLCTKVAYHILVHLLVHYQPLVYTLTYSNKYQLSYLVPGGMTQYLWCCFLFIHLFTEIHVTCFTIYLYACSILSCDYVFESQVNGYKKIKLNKSTSETHSISFIMFS